MLCACYASLMAWMQFSAFWIRLKENIPQTFEKTLFPLLKRSLFSSSVMRGIHGSGIQLLLLAPPIVSIGRRYSERKTQVCCEYKALFIFWMKTLYLGETASEVCFLFANLVLFSVFIPRVFPRGCSGEQACRLHREKRCSSFVCLVERAGSLEINSYTFSGSDFPPLLGDSCKYSVLLNV